ncbi:M43 family zinc metalloprotease [Ferruginibacter sp.]
MKKYILQPHIFLLIHILIATCLYTEVYAQQNTKPKQNCSTKTPLVITKYTQEQLNGIERTIDYLYVIRVYVHILRDNDGTNAATTEAQMHIDLQTMTNFFKPHNICFMFVGFEYVNNTFLNNSMNPGLAADEASLLANNKHNDAIDIYVHRSLGDGSGGNSYNIPSDHFSVVQANNFNFYHEMGHCLGLLHTFETSGGTECPDGSNCNNSGDLVCDTQADFGGSENMVTPPNSCIYTGNQTIVCNGSTRSYAPPINNIMSYWAACYTQFTVQQATRMRATIANQNVVNKCLVTLDATLYANSINITILNEFYMAAKSDIRIGAVTPGNTVFIGSGNGKKYINAGNKITIMAGTVIRPASSPTKFFINKLCD